MRLQIRALGRGAVTVRTSDLDCRLHLAVKVAAAVIVLREMTVDALHAEIDMDRIKMHCLLEFLRVGGRDDVVAVVEQIALAVTLEDRAKIPTVAVVVGEFGVGELRVELAY